MIDELVIASRNKDKIRELEDLLDPLGIRVRSALDFPELEEVEEDLPTLEGNALKKARYVHGVTGLPALSDDTGLEVEALNGAPGVYSARYAGLDVTYDDNVTKLLSEMEGKDHRDAQFRTAVAFITSSDEHVFEGIAKGSITSERRGDNGFGYDPVFFSEAFGKTYAELTKEEKQSVSHRGKAVRAFVEFLAANQ